MKKIFSEINLKDFFSWKRRFFLLLVFFCLFLIIIWLNSPDKTSYQNEISVQKQKIEELTGNYQSEIRESDRLRSELNSTKTELESLKYSISPYKNTLYYAYSGNQLFLKLEDKIFKANTELPISSDKQFEQDQNLNWQKIMTDKSINKYNVLFDFKELTNKDFVFVIEEDQELEGNLGKVFFNVFHFNETKGVSNLFTKSSRGSGKYVVPRIESISKDGRFVEFNMYGCWGCGGHQPETLLVDINSAKTKNIGKVAVFGWLENGNYEYKEYIAEKCDGYGGECPIDTSNLPFKRGTM